MYGKVKKKLMGFVVISIILYGNHSLIWFSYFSGFHANHRTGFSGAGWCWKWHIFENSKVSFFSLEVETESLRIPPWSLYELNMGWDHCKRPPEHLIPTKESEGLVGAAGTSLSHNLLIIKYYMRKKRYQPAFQIPEQSHGWMIEEKEWMLGKVWVES